MIFRKNEYSALDAAIEAAQRFWAEIICNTRVYTFPSAPSPQRVHIFLQEKGIEAPNQTVDLIYTAATPNGHKVSCTLAALEIPYNAIAVNLAESDNKRSS